MQIPGGWAAQRWGGRRMLMVSFSLWSTASLLTPATAASTSAIMLARVAVGIAQGFLIPSVHTVLSQVCQLLPQPCEHVSLDERKTSHTYQVAGHATLACYVTSLCHRGQA